MKTILISGASRGIGKAVAETLSAEGFKVGIMARNSDDLNAIAAAAKPGSIVPLPLDITDEAAVKKTVAEFVDEFGQIDVLINNAGFGVFKEAAELQAEEWDQIMEVNVKGTFMLSRQVLPHMKRQGSGHIIGIASDVSKRTFANGSLYCASKYAQDAFLSALRKEVRKDKIKVSVIYPGLVDTYFHGNASGDENQVEFLKPHDIAASVSYIINAPAHVVVDELMIHPISQEY